MKVLDAGVKPRRCAARATAWPAGVCGDVAKALGGDAVVEAMLARSACSENAADAPAYRWSAAHVDSLIDQSVAAAINWAARTSIPVVHARIFRK